MFSSLLHITPYLIKPWIARDALQAAVLIWTHREGWAAENPEPRSARSFLAPFPHQNFRQCQTTATSAVSAKAATTDCSKQCGQTQHRAGQSSARVCQNILNHVGENRGWFVSPTQNEGRGLSLKEKAHKILTTCTPHHSGNIFLEIITTRPVLPSVQTGSSGKIILWIKTFYMKCGILFMQVVLKSLQRDHGMAVVNTFWKYSLLFSHMLKTSLELVKTKANYRTWFSFRTLLPLPLPPEKKKKVKNYFCMQTFQVSMFRS